MIVLYGPNGLSGLLVLSLVVEAKDKRLENASYQMVQEATSRNYFVLEKAF